MEERSLHAGTRNQGLVVFTDIDENFPNHTPIQRRLLRDSTLNSVVLSPTKRRKQVHTSEPTRDKLGKSSAVWKPLPAKELPLRELSLVFARLGSRDIIERCAPVCRTWRDLAHSRELWATLSGHLRLIDQVVVAEKLVERRSKGKLFRCKRLGTNEAVLTRIVNLENANAGKDDGVPTSFLREAALLGKVQHPNIVRHFGAEILGKEVVICIEFVHESLTSWAKRLERQPACVKVVEIRHKFRQILVGLSHLHHNGVMHRNLKPDNIFVDVHNTVKLGDFTTTRMLDIPFQAYTPEETKERERSGREMRRLWYRAPELILRDDIYGPKVDTWSVGCLLAEAATGRALFQSDSEIDHLFRTFRLVGTPRVDTWPEVLSMRNFSPKFPVYNRICFAQVTRAACHASAVDQDMLLQEVTREELVQNLSSVAVVLGPDGMFALDMLLEVPPSKRAGADTVLELPFFACPTEGTDRKAFGNEAHPTTALWLRGDRTSTFGKDSPVQASGALPSCAPIRVPAGLMPPQMVWDILCVMQQREIPPDGCFQPKLPAGLDKGDRASVMNFIVDLANTLGLTNYTLHLATSVVDNYLSLHDRGVVPAKLRVIGATCLKVADVFAEQSKEYYRQANAVEYADVTNNQATPAEMLECEKDLLQRLKFDFRLPTTHWFLQCYLAYGRLLPTSAVSRTASFINDLVLLDYDILIYPPSLRAQCMLVLAAYIVQRAQAHDAATNGCDLALLEQWNTHVRSAACRGNTSLQVAMCMRALVKALSVTRREWRSQDLCAAEVKHASVVRTIAYPEFFPINELAKYALPDIE